MAMDVDAQAAEWKYAALKGILKAPMPWDSANDLKHALMLELLPPTGDKLFERVWLSLETAFVATAQATPIALVTGVSGMGKTKVACDIGVQHAFVVMSRVVEHDSFTPPWGTYRDFAHEVVRSAQTGPSDGLPPLAERISLQATLIVLLAAHLEWAVNVSKAACDASLAGAFSAAAARFSADTTPALRLRVLRELVLRGQRNGLAYQHVKALFQRAMQRILADPSAMAEDGTLTVSMDPARQYMAAVVREARPMWGGEQQRIVWVHDEVQALLNVAGLPADLFTGVFASAVATPLPSSLPRGLFYGVLAAIREVLTTLTCAHLLLGNNLDLSNDVLNQHSPAQGVATMFDEAVNLTAADMRQWLAGILTPTAMSGVEAPLLAALCGRPLFISKFWSALIARLASGRVFADDGAALGPALLVREALQTAREDATKAAIARIDNLWVRHEPSASGHVPSSLIRYLFHELVMTAGGGGNEVGAMRVELRDAIKRGILNARGEGRVSLDGEPLTADALREVGMRRVREGSDGIMQLLASRMTRSAGGAIADQGPAQEDCMAWALVRRCLVRSGARLNLRELLEPFLARHDTTVSVSGDTVHAELLPPLLDDTFVALDGGMRCDGVLWQARCPLSQLHETPTLLMHHTIDAMGGPDAIFCVRKADGSDAGLVVLQLKNRSTGGLADALRSLDLGFWYPDHRHEGIVQEHAAHVDLREALEAHPRWARPVRVVVTARSFHPRVQYMAARLNRSALEHVPVLFVQTTRDNLGVDIAPSGVLPNYDAPRDWLCMWPTAVKRWPAGSPPLPALPDMPAQAPDTVTLKVTLTSTEAAGPAAQAALVGDARRFAREAVGEVVDETRHRTDTASITAEFSHILAALTAVEACAPGTHRIRGHVVSAEFAH